MIKDILFGENARDKIKKGVETLAGAVKATLGPSGKNVIISPFMQNPVVTKDGVSVANSIELRDHLENVGAQMVRMVASKTSTDAGDGTTTATVLAEAIFKGGLAALSAGESPLGLRRGIEKAVDAAIVILEESATKISDKKEIVHIGTIASNNDSQIGEMLAEAMEKVGKDGVVTLEESTGHNTFIDYVEGMQFDKGYASPFFAMFGGRFKVEYKDPMILLHEGRMDSIVEWQTFLSKVAHTGRPIVIIASDFSDEVLQALFINLKKGVLKSVAVKAPGFGQRRKDILVDLAALSGGNAILSEDPIDLEKASPEGICGTCEKIIVTNESTTLVGGAEQKDKIKERINLIREELKEVKSDFDREKLQERLAKLTGGVAKIYVGGQTEVEMKEKKDRIEDALHATRAAIEEGILPGGGVALLRIHKSLDLKLEKYEQKGADILQAALRLPAMQIAENAGRSGEVVIDKILSHKKDYSFGYNALKDKYENLLEAGVIDPLKVTKCALQNAASVAVLLLTTDVIVVEDPQISEKLLQQAMGQQY